MSRTSDQLTDSPFCIAVDWGTSSLRLWLLAEDGGCLAERRSDEGMLRAKNLGFDSLLAAHLIVLGDLDVPVIICGMAGARQGWLEAPYIETPAGLGAIAHHAVRVPEATCAKDVRILPGVAQKTPADVMRGEETQILGLGAAGTPALICMPGTHSKWVSHDQDGIERFATYMTGELYAVLGGHSILQHNVQDANMVDPADTNFELAVCAMLRDPAGFLRELFAIRAEGLLSSLSAQAASTRLSGLLIGQEIAAVVRQFGQDRPVRLVSSGQASACYLHALEIAGFDVRLEDSDAAVRRGLYQAACVIWRNGG